MSHWFEANIYINGKLVKHYPKTSTHHCCYVLKAGDVTTFKILDCDPELCVWGVLITCIKEVVFKDIVILQNIILTKVTTSLVNITQILKMYMINISKNPREFLILVDFLIVMRRNKYGR